MESRKLKIGEKYVGYDELPFFIAEIGINHNGDLNTAKKLIDVAVLSGCDAVKFQKRTVDVVYTPEELARPRESIFGGTNGHLKRGLEFGKEQYDEIDRYCKEKGILWFASPWDEASVDFLEQYNPPCYKIASACNADKELLEYIKSKNRPMLVSFGMSDEELMEKVVNLLGEENLVIMHCNSSYPAKEHELDLHNISRLIKKYPQSFVGYSGHEVGLYSTLAAACLGACVVERHISLDRAMWGSDQAASVEMVGLMKLVRDIKSIPVWKGQAVTRVTEAEKSIAQKLRRKITI